MIVGSEIGKGKWRTVYRHPSNISFVIKRLTPLLSPSEIKHFISSRMVCTPSSVEYNPNLTEWRVWHLYKGTSLGAYLCPCIEISCDHKYLTMMRAQHASPEKIKSMLSLNMLKKLSAIGLRDIEGTHQWGFINDRPVLLDYGFIVSNPK